MIRIWLEDTRHKILVMTAVIFLLGALVGKHFLIDTDLGTLKDLAGQLAAENQKEETLGKLSELDKKIKNYDRYFEKTEDNSWLIENVNRLAVSSGVNLGSITPQQTEMGENFNKLFLRLELRCGYHELGKFLSGIESGPRFIKISEVNAQSLMGGQQSPEKKLNVTVLLTVYCLRQSALA